MRARRKASEDDGVGEELREPAAAESTPAGQDAQAVQSDAEMDAATRLDVQEALDTAKGLGQGVVAGATAAMSAAKAVGQAVGPVVGKAVDMTGKAIDAAVPVTTKAVEVATPIVKRGLEVSAEAAQDAASKATPVVRQFAQDALEKAQQNPSLKEAMDSTQPALRTTTDALEKIKSSPELRGALSQTKSALEAAAPVAKSAVSGTAKVVVSGSKVAAGTLEVLAGTETKEQLLDTMKNEASATGRVAQEAAGVVLPIASKVAQEAADVVLPAAKQAGQAGARMIGDAIGDVINSSPDAQALSKRVSGTLSEVASQKEAVAQKVTGTLSQVATQKDAVVNSVVQGVQDKGGKALESAREQLQQSRPGN